MLRALALLATLALASTALAEERCSLEGKQARVAAALVVHRSTSGVETDEVDKLDTLWRNKPFEPACAALAVKWLGSDDLRERLAGAAYWLRYRVKREQKTFLVIFTVDPGELNPFPATADDTKKWLAQASSETSLPVVEAKLDVGGLWSRPPEVRAQYLLGAKAVLLHAPGLVETLIDTLEQALDVRVPPEVQELIWKHRGQSDIEDMDIDRILAWQGNPKERALVQRTLKRAKPKTFVDRQGVLPNAYQLGLGDLAQPFVLATVDADRSTSRCSHLAGAFATAVRHLPTILALLDRAQGCGFEIEYQLEKSLKGAPGLEENLPRLVSAMEKVEGERYGLYGTEAICRALPADAKLDDFELLADSIRSAHPPYLPPDFEQAVQKRIQTASPDERARLQKLIADLERDLH